MPETVPHVAIFETYDGYVRQLTVTGTREDVQAAAKRAASLDDTFCIRWADTNTCACAHYLGE